jgi:hypothetical protein
LSRRYQKPELGLYINKSIGGKHGTKEFGGKNQNIKYNHTIFRTSALHVCTYTHVNWEAENYACIFNLIRIIFLFKKSRKVKHL